MENDHITNEPKEKEWVNLCVISFEDGNTYDLGKVYFSESIKSIKEKIEKSFGIKVFDIGDRRGGYLLYETLGGNIRDYCKPHEVFYLSLLPPPTLGGGPGDVFIDIENSKIRELEFGEGPEYRRVIRGLNFLGKCINKKCRIKDKKFYIKIGIGSFDYFRLKNEGKFICPICDYPITPESCGFWNCKYQVEGEGRKVSETKAKSFSRSGVAGAERFTLFDPESEFEDKVIYFKLMFIVS